MAKAQINKQDTLASEREEAVPQSTSAPEPESIRSPELMSLHEAAINAPSHPLVVADPEHRVHTDAIPATRIGELPGPVGTAEIHGSTQGVVFRDGDPDPEGWYSGQGGITGDRSRDMAPHAVKD
jgi:hypothetical protein